jgi:hypothetical protein
MLNKTSGTVIAILPVGYRPAQRLVFSLESSSGSVRVDVFANGEIVCSANPVWISLSGINFRL